VHDGALGIAIVVVHIRALVSVFIRLSFDCVVSIFKACCCVLPL